MKNCREAICQLFGSNTVKSFFKASLFGITLVTSTSVMAQSVTESKIPKELLELDRKRCEADCTPTYGETTCKALCNCTVVEFDKRLDFDKYVVLSAQLSRNELSPESRLLLDVIAKRCTALVEQSGIVIGPVDPKGEKTEPAKPN